MDHAFLRRCDGSVVVIEVSAVALTFAVQTTAMGRTKGDFELKHFSNIVLSGSL